MRLATRSAWLFAFLLSTPAAADDWTSLEKVSVRVDDLVTIAVDGHLACGVDEDGGVPCWSLRRAERGAKPVIVNHFPNVEDGRDVAVAGGVVCVLRGPAEDGRVECARLSYETSQWGTVYAVPALNAPLAIDGDNRRVCAVETGGTVGCLDIGRVEVVTRVPNLTRAVAVATGQFHACALRDDGSVHCWGNNAYGALGTTRDTEGPMRIGGVEDAVAVAVGPRHSCAVEREGEVICWGFGAPTAPAKGEMVRASFDGPATVVDALDATTCAVVDERIACLGHHPTQFAELDDVVSLAITPHLACTLDDDGDVECVGMVINAFPEKREPPRRRTPSKPRWLGTTVSSRIGVGGGTRISPRTDQQKLFEMSLRTDVLIGDGPFEKEGSALGVTLDLRSADFETWEAGLGPMLTSGGKGEKIHGLAGGIGHAKRPGDHSGSFLFGTWSLSYREALKKRRANSMRWSYGFSMSLYVSARWGLADARYREVTAGIAMESFMVPAVFALAGGGIYALITGEKNPVLSK